MKKTLQLLLIVFTISMQGQNRLLSSIQQSYFNGVYTNNYGENYEYDTNNNMIVQTEYIWENGAFKTSSKSTYTYNINNKVIQSIYQGVNPQTNQLVNEGKDIFTYTNGNLTTIEYQRWLNSNWVNDYKIVITYNASNLPTSSIASLWSNVQWVNDELSTFGYNANNKINTVINQQWTNAQWLNALRTAYNYNANSKIVSKIGAYWNVPNNVWLIGGGAPTTNYVLDPTSNRTLEIYREDDYGYQTQYYYDSSSLMNSFAHPFKDKTGVDYVFSDFPYVNKILSEEGYSYSVTLDSYTLSSRTTYNYNSAITLNTETIVIADNSIIVYPNPTKDFLFVKSASNAIIDKITVIDLTGKKVFEQNNSNNIDVQNLVKGMYVLEVFAGDNKEMKKFIKE